MIRDIAPAAHEVMLAARRTFTAVNVIAGLLPGLVVLTMLYNPDHLSHDQRISFLTYCAAGAALLLAIASIAYQRYQMELAFIQLSQAEELAERKDENLIGAIEALTAELKRRPLENYSTVVFSLFGTKE